MQFKKQEIHTVFLCFLNFYLGQNLSASALADLIRASLIKTKKETIISKQIVRSGTSIGANINEANYGQSKADFISKLHIALKETAETEYWLRLLAMSEYINGGNGGFLTAGLS